MRNPKDDDHKYIDPNDVSADGGDLWEQAGDVSKSFEKEDPFVALVNGLATHSAE